MILNDFLMDDGYLAEAMRSGRSVYPLATRDEWHGDVDYAVRGGVLTSMTPDAYLDSVRPLVVDEVSRENIDDLKRHIQQGRTLDPLSIYADGKEDGRHRAHAAKELGIKTVPVLDFRKRDLTEADTNSPRFRQWFRGSKVCNTDGTPLRVFHGTNKDFDAFSAALLGKNTGHPTSKLGFYFTASPDAAAGFATHAGSTGANVRACYLAIKKPWTISTRDFGSAFVRGMNRGFYGADEKIEQVLRTLKSKGFDGIRIIGINTGNPAYEFHSDNWVAFEPSQIWHSTLDQPDE